MPRMTVMPVIVAALMKHHVHESAAHKGLVILDADSVLAAVHPCREQESDQRCEHDRRDARNGSPYAVPWPDEPPNDQAHRNAVQDYGQSESSANRVTGPQGGSFQQRV